MKIKNILLIAACLLAINAQATIRYVTPNGAGTQDGSSWENASNDLQAMHNASDWYSDTIFVATGTYKAIRKTTSYNTDEITPNHRNNAFVLTRNVQIFGSFAGWETSLEERQLSTSGDYTSILSGDFNGNDGANFSGMNENAYNVVIGIKTNARLDGFTITGGNANNNDVNTNRILVALFEVAQNLGGGIYGNQANYVLTNVKISGNRATRSGGGMYNNSSNAVLTNVIISGNMALDGFGGSGGGMYNNMCAPVLNSVTISRNKAYDGGGVYTNGSYNSFWTNVIVSDNTADWQGGGIVCAGSNVVMTNMIISGNTARKGGGIYFFGNFSNYVGQDYVHLHSHLTNVTISGNTATDGLGSGIYNYTYPNGIELGLDTARYLCAPEIRNSIIWGNTSDNVFNTEYSAPVYSYSLVEGEALTDGIILNSDPLFDHNFNLQAGSPAINAGNNLFFAAGQTPDLSAITSDLAGNPRTFDNTVDLGAYEFQQEMPTAINTISSEKEKTIIGYYNIMGQKLPQEPASGLFIILYDNGESEKRIK